MAHGILPEKYGRELQAIKTFRAKLMPTRLETPEQIRKFKRENPPGTRFTTKNKNGKYSTYRVE